MDSNYYDAVYEPREDTYLLSDAAVEWYQRVDHQGATIKVLEVGCGSGEILVDIAKAYTTKVAGCHESKLVLAYSDINPKALELTAKRLKQFNDIEVHEHVSDLLTNIPDIGSVDLLLFNPPYVPTPLEELQAARIINGNATNKQLLTLSWAGGPSGRIVIDSFVAQLHERYFVEGGDRKKTCLLLLEQENDVADIIATLKSANPHLICNVVASKKAFNERLVVLQIDLI